MSGVLVVGAEPALELAGIPRSAGAVRLVVALDGAPAPPEPGAPLVRWWRTRAPLGESVRSEHVLAPAGDELWSAAPWPVADAAFGMPRSRDGRVLVVDASDVSRSAVLRELAGRDVEATGAPWLTLAGLADADVVVHSVGPPGPLPGDAMSVLAAGRLLIVNAEPTFGLVPGIDHLRAEGPAPAADLVEAFLGDPGAFEAVRTTGRLAAGRHRAAEVYSRLADELA